MIVDCFTFFDELDLLEVRLNELKDIVDVFVLVESPTTFSGLEKPLYFKDNKKRFDNFNIINVIYYDTEKSGRPIDREGRQKQYGLDFIFDNLFTGNDILIQGDVDEIPKRESIAEFKESSIDKQILSMNLFYYYMNCKEIGNPRTRYKNSRLLKPKERIKYDEGQKRNNIPIIQNSGWHFSFMGDIQSKIKAWGHSDQYDKPPYNTKEHIETCINNGTDLFMRKRKNLKFEFTDDLSYLPEYVLDNMDKFEKYIR